MLFDMFVLFSKTCSKYVLKLDALLLTRSNKENRAQSTKQNKKNQSNVIHCRNLLVISENEKALFQCLVYPKLKLSTKLKREITKIIVLSTTKQCFPSKHLALLL